MLELQRSIGNQALQRLFNSPFIQTKLQISTPGDPFEREADRTAETVMRMAEPEETEEKIKPVQRQPLATRISRIVQRASTQALHGEKEKAPSSPLIQRVPLAVREDEEEEKVARQSEGIFPEEKEETIQTKILTDAPLQRRTRDEDENERELKGLPLVQRLCTQCEGENERGSDSSGEIVQRLAANKRLSDDDLEEHVHPKASQAHAPTVTPSVAANIYALRGGGSPMPETTRAFFEPRFGVDFSHVRVHTSSGAESAAHEVAARAFTVGSHIAFASGEYRPETSSGRRLIAHELVHTIQQGAQGAGATEGRIQRTPNKKEEPLLRFSITPATPLTAQEFRIFAAKQIFGVGDDQAAEIAANFTWTGPHSTGGVQQEGVGKPLMVQVSARLYRSLKGVATSEGEEVDPATGRAEGSVVRAKEVEHLPTAEKKTIYDEVDLRFWDRTEYNRGRPLGKSPQDKAMAQLWLDIRDEVLIERQKLAAMPDALRGVLGAVSLKPQDYSQLVRIAETLTESEWVDYASRVTAKTNDLNQLEAAVLAYREANRKRESDVSRRKEVQNKLYGTESLYSAYLEYRKKRDAASGSWQPGAGDNMVWVEPFPGDVAAAQTAEKSLNDRLVVAGFPGGIPEYEKSLRDLLKAFEIEAVHIGVAALDQYESFLWKQNEYYQNDAVISALYDQLAPLREEYAEILRLEKVMHEAVRQPEESRVPGSAHVGKDPKKKKIFEDAHAKGTQHKAASEAIVKALTDEHPIFSEAHLPLKRRIPKSTLAQADKSGLKKLLLDHIAARTEDVQNTRKNLRDDPELIYKMDQLMGEVHRRMEIQPGSVFDTLINDRARQIARDEALVQFFLAVLAIAFTILTLGTGAIAVVGAAGALAVGGYAAYEEFEKFRIASEAAGSGLSSKEPSPAWLVLAVVGVVFDATQAVKAVRALSSAARILEATGDVAAFQRAVKVLEDTAVIQTKVARAAEIGAKARQGAEAAGSVLSDALSKASSLADPDVYKAVVQWAYHRARQGLSSLHEFILELNKARIAQGLAELSESELALAKKAAAEGFEAAEKRTAAHLAKDVRGEAALAKVTTSEVSDLLGAPIRTTGGEIKLSKAGHLFKCTNPCAHLREKYAAIFAKESQLEGELAILEKRALDAAAEAKSGGPKAAELAEAVKKDAAALERRIELGVDPKRGYIPHEGEVGPLIENRYGGFARDPSGAGEWIGTSGKLKGKVFDLLGIPPGKAKYHSDALEKFLPSVDDHFRKSIDFVVLDTRYMTAGQRLTVLNYVKTRWASEAKRLIVL